MAKIYSQTAWNDERIIGGYLRIVELQFLLRFDRVLLNWIDWIQKIKQRIILGAQQKPNSTTAFQFKGVGLLVGQLMDLSDDYLGYVGTVVQA